MYKTVFQNSKAALAFAAMTLFGAMAMVGTPEDSGVVVKAADILGAERAKFANDAQAFAKGQSEGDRPSNLGTEWGEDTAVFGAYSADGPPAMLPQPYQAPGPGGFDPVDAPLLPGAIATPTNNQLPPKLPPYISDRELVIEIQ
ncbi:MAG: hypothetical protein GW858_01590 [Sphingomonadales bacterium]|nr:hypothetical protein [Sphingomonadales bacterium]NCQ22591.1 hypothetical protein [Sphingomonadales bacterium]NCT04053.1 hypothetical protein [Sphingomonadales bacterium]